MTTSKLGFLALLVASAGCTTSSDADLSALAAGISTVELSEPLPLPTGPSPINKTPLINLCQGKVDVAVGVQTGSNYNYKDWVYVCTPITNKGTVAWSSNAAQVQVTMSNSLGGSATGAGFASLAPGATINRCAWQRATGLLRMGHDTAKWGECQLTMEVTSRLVFDPDIAMDGNTANDDCLSSNNTRKVTWKYMGVCPW